MNMCLYYAMWHDHSATRNSKEILLKDKVLPVSTVSVLSGSYDLSMAARKLSFTPGARADLLDANLPEVTCWQVVSAVSSSSSRMPFVCRSSSDLCFFSEDADAVSPDDITESKQTWRFTHIELVGNRSSATTLVLNVSNPGQPE